MEIHEFKIACPIEKAYEADAKYYVRGLATGVNVDLDHERMAESVMEAFKKSIDDGIILSNGEWSEVPLRVSHRDDFVDVIGYLVSADIDVDKNLIIEAELDMDNPHAVMLYRKLTTSTQKGRPVMLGLSVGGKVQEIAKEWHSDLNKYIVVFKRVALKEISVTSHPANPITYLVALTKSIDWSKVKGLTQFDTDDESVDPFDMLIKGDSMKDVITTETVEEVATEEVVVKTEAAVAEEVVTKTEEVVTETEVSKTTAQEEVVETDPLAGIKAQIDVLTKSLATLNDVVQELAKSTTEEAHATETVEVATAKVEKTETEVAKTEEVVVEKTETNTNLDAFADVVKSLLSAEIKPLLARINELENQEVDGSIAVQVQKYTDAADPLAQFEDELQKSENMSGRDIIKRSLQYATNSVK